MPQSDRRLLSLKATAYHEAGHTVAAIRLGITFSKVWILKREETDAFPDGENIGEVTRPQPIDKPKFVGRLEDAKTEAIQSFAGPIAECLPWPELHPDWQLNANDVSLARSFLRFAMLPFEIKEGVAHFPPAEIQRTWNEVEAILQGCAQKAETLVKENTAAIERIATALLVRFEISADEARQIAYSKDEEAKDEKAPKEE